MTEKIVVFSNCGSEEEARRIARALVEARVAACVNIVPGIQSIYRGKGPIQEDSEWMLVIKSTRSMFDQLSAELRKIHSYQVPEVLAIPVVAGNQDYLDWMDRETVGSDNFNKSMLRREFLAGLAVTPAFDSAKTRIDRSRISFITDEAAANQADSVAFAKQYGLRWIELREVPGGGGHYMRQSDEKLKEAAKLFQDNGIKVSFLNSPMFKITLPGTEPVFRKPETPESA